MYTDYRIPGTVGTHSRHQTAVQSYCTSSPHVEFALSAAAASTALFLSPAFSLALYELSL